MSGKAHLMMSNADRDDKICTLVKRGFNTNNNPKAEKHVEDAKQCDARLKASSNCCTGSPVKKQFCTCGHNPKTFQKKAISSVPGQILPGRPATSPLAIEPTTVEIPEPKSPPTEIPNEKSPHAFPHLYQKGEAMTNKDGQWMKGRVNFVLSKPGYCDLILYAPMSGRCIGCGKGTCMQLQSVTPDPPKVVFSMGDWPKQFQGLRLKCGACSSTWNTYDWQYISSVPIHHQPSYWTSHGNWSWFAVDRVVMTLFRTNLPVQILVETMRSVLMTKYVFQREAYNAYSRSREASSGETHVPFPDFPKNYVPSAEIIRKAFINQKATSSATTQQHTTPNLEPPQVLPLAIEPTTVVTPKPKSPPTEDAQCENPEEAELWDIIEKPEEAELWEIIEKSEKILLAAPTVEVGGEIIDYHKEFAKMVEAANSVTPDDIRAGVMELAKEKTSWSNTEMQSKRKATKEILPPPAFKARRSGFELWSDVDIDPTRTTRDNEATRNYEAIDLTETTPEGEGGLFFEDIMCSGPQHAITVLPSKDKLGEVVDIGGVQTSKDKSGEVVDMEGASEKKAAAIRYKEEIVVREPHSLTANAERDKSTNKAILIKRAKAKMYGAHPAMNETMENTFNNILASVVPLNGGMSFLKLAEKVQQQYRLVLISGQLRCLHPVSFAEVKKWVTDQLGNQISATKKGEVSPLAAAVLDQHAEEMELNYHSSASTTHVAGRHTNTDMEVFQITRQAVESPWVCPKPWGYKTLQQIRDTVLVQQQSGSYNDRVRRGLEQAEKLGMDMAKQLASMGIQYTEAKNHDGRKHRACPYCKLLCKKEVVYPARDSAGMVAHYIKSRSVLYCPLADNTTLLVALQKDSLERHKLRQKNRNKLRAKQG